MRRDPGAGHLANGHLARLAPREGHTPRRHRGTGGFYRVARRAVALGSIGARKRPV